MRAKREITRLWVAVAVLSLATLWVTYNTRQEFKAMLGVQKSVVRMIEQIVRPSAPLRNFLREDLVSI